VRIPHASGAAAPGRVGVHDGLTLALCWFMPTSPIEDSGVLKPPATFETPHWETPTCDLIRMDAEIGSYQEDYDHERRGAVVPAAQAGRGSPPHFSSRRNPV